MVLKHIEDICSLKKSVFKKDIVFQDILKNLSPTKIYTENKEFIESFGTTIVNYSPISLNISDYWNKDIYNSSIFVPKLNDEEIDWSFRFEDGIDETGWSLRNGFDEGPFSLWEKVNINFNGICKDHDGFYLNSLIGLQDKLAYTFKNDFYIQIDKTLNNHNLNYKLRIYKEKIGIDENSEIFDKVNSIFSDDMFFASKEIILTKGQSKNIAFIFKLSHDAQIEGKELTRPFFFNFITNEPFDYTIESSILPCFFENFIKPLTHPLGFTYKYHNICKTEFEETPLRITYDRAERVYVYELCMSVDENDNRVSPGDDNNPPQPLENNNEIIKCPIDTNNVSNYDYEYTIATSNGNDLWDGIASDEGNGNILKFIEKGIYPSGYFKNYYYNKYIFENENYLIEYINPSNSNKTIEYYRKAGNTYTLISRWVERRHVTIKMEGHYLKYETPIDANFTYECIDQPEYGIFGFLDDETCGSNYGFGNGIIWDTTPICKCQA